MKKKKIYLFDMIYRLRHARTMAGYSLREAAKIIGMSHEWIRRCEKGKIAMDSKKLILFANAYKVPIDTLIPRDTRPKVELQIVHIKYSKK